jgi:tRNA (adenine37-N6)-methyltransferase
MDSLNFEPIGFFHSTLDNPNEAPRQPNPALPETAGFIQLREGFHFEDAVRDLNGFTKIWVIFQFHRNDQWNPMVSPPRGSDKKRGVFATRSPHRPNPIGQSVLDLISVDGLVIKVGPADLLNGTPILDIKPYLPYVDSHPDAKIGWLEESNTEKFVISWSPLALVELSFLESRGLTQLRGFVMNQLEYEPADAKKKRLYFMEDKTLLAYRTWRIQFQINDESKQVQVLKIKSGYSTEELHAEDDPYHDKDLHRAYLKQEFN